MEAKIWSEYITSGEVNFNGICTTVRISSDCGEGIFSTAMQSEAVEIVKRINEFNIIVKQRDDAYAKVEKLKKRLEKLKAKIKDLEVR